MAGLFYISSGLVGVSDERSIIGKIFVKPPNLGIFSEYSVD